MIACEGPIAGKPAPTGTALSLKPVQYLWELACRRLPSLGLEGFHTFRGTQQQQVRRPRREQAVGHHADDGVDLRFQFHRVGDLQVVHIEDYIAVVGDHTFAVHRVAAQLDQLTRHMAAGHGDDFDRQREGAQYRYQLAGVGDADEGLGHGADESDAHLNLIKGGGAALTREKIVAAVAKTFICIADASKLVPVLGAFPLPVEVIPMARSHVARQLVKLGGDPVYREGVVTDNGNIILDVHNLQITNPVELESQINAIVGVVTNGLFAARPADLLLLGTSEGVKTLKVS